MNKGDALFGNLIEIASITCDMARELNGFLQQYHAPAAENYLLRLHGQAREANAKRQALTEAAARAFVTPVDRGDLIRVSQCLGRIPGASHDVLAQFCVTRIQQLRPDTLRLSELMIRCCDAVRKLTESFGDLKRYGVIADCIAGIRRLAEEGDRIHMHAMKALYTVYDDLLEVARWRDVFGAFMNVCNRCNNVADLAEAVTVDNG